MDALWENHLHFNYSARKHIQRAYHQHQLWVRSKLHLETPPFHGFVRSGSFWDCDLKTRRPARCGHVWQVCSQELKGHCRVTGLQVCKCKGGDVVKEHQWTLLIVLIPGLCSVTLRIPDHINMTQTVHSSRLCSILKPELIYIYTAIPGSQFNGF